MTGTMNTCNRSQGHSTTVNIRLRALHLFRIRSAFVKCFLFSREHRRPVFHKVLCSKSQSVRMLSVYFLLMQFISLYMCIITKGNIIILKKCHLVQNRPLSPADLAFTEDCGVLCSLPIDRTLDLLGRSSRLTAQL
jgi:hypothetical protein